MRQNILNQNGLVIWLTGLSGAGKSTIAAGLEQKLNDAGFFTFGMDGDLIRSGINRDLSFSEADRSENIRRVMEISKMLVQKKVIVICAFITPLQQQREANRNTLGKQYFEVFVDCPVAVCENRDVKGLYKKARNNDISDFTGVSTGYELPLHPELILNSAAQSADQCITSLYQMILPLVEEESSGY
jgi:adenylyl-sulfate kinase